VYLADLVESYDGSTQRDLFSIVKCSGRARKCRVSPLNSRLKAAIEDIKRLEGLNLKKMDNYLGSRGISVLTIREVRFVGTPEVPEWVALDVVTFYPSCYPKSKPRYYL